MTLVWDSSPYKDGSLLLLLALADFANDEGVCFPGVPTLAKKCRMDDRSIRRILRKFEEDEIISIETQHGRNHTNIYHINIAKLKPDNKPSFESVKPDNMSAFQNDRNLTLDTLKPDIENTKPDIRYIKPDTRVRQTIIEPSEEPSINHHTHTLESQPAHESRVCVSETQIGKPIHEGLSRHSEKVIHEYRLAHPEIKTDGWEIKAKELGLHDERIDRWLSQRFVKSSHLQLAPNPYLTFNQAAQQIVSMQKVLLPEHIPRFIDDLDVSDETREKLREEFLEKEIA